MRCIYSNRVECLFDKLSENLFSGASSDPFARRMVLVASPAMRSWVQLRFARNPDIQIAAGIDIGLIDPSIEKLAGMKSQFPSMPALALAIEALLHAFPDENLPPYLASKLADLFRRYGTYGGGMVERWETEAGLQGQAALWNRLFCGSRWGYPAKLASMPAGRRVDSVHLFAASFLPKVYLEFLEELSKSCQVYCYALSPCRAFWCDIMAEKQQSRLLRKLAGEGISLDMQFALEDMLAEANPLLANFGRMGREMASVLEGYDEHPIQEYVLPRSALDYCQYEERADRDVCVEDAGGGLTLLQAVQADLMLLRPVEDERLVLGIEDGSIQVHAAPTRWREVQALYNVLVDEIQKSQIAGDPITPGDIIVMAPDISAYIPYMKAVFESSDSKLSLQVMDLKLPSQSPYIQAFTSLLKLGEGAWETDVLLDLLDYAPLMGKMGWSQEEAGTIRRWTQAGHVHWGFDQEHRDAYLKKKHCDGGMIDRSPAGTWKNCLGLLCEALIAKNDGSACSVEVSDGPLLGQWWSFLHRLREQLDPIIIGKRKTVQDWTIFLEALAEEFLTSSCDEDAESSCLLLRQTLCSFREVSGSVSVELDFAVIFRHLLSALDNISVSYREGNLQAVKCCSMLPMRAVPSKVVVLMGMDADSFPKKGQELLALDQLLVSGEGDYCPRPNDFDRYLFLEAVLSARSKLLLFFPGSWAHGSHASERLPSTLLQELLSYLDRAYVLGDKPPSQVCVTEHPVESYHYSYFDGLHRPSYLPCDWRWAKSRYLDAKERKKGFFDAFSPAEMLPGRINSLDIKQLRELARHPLEEFFNGVLGTHPDRPMVKVRPSEEPLALTRMDAGLLRKQSISQDWEAVVHDSVMKGKMPLAPIKNVFLSTLNPDISRIHRLLEELRVDPLELKSLVFSEHFHEPRLAEGGVYELPPLAVPRKGNTLTYLEGEVPLVSAEGLVVYSQAGWEDLVKVWPIYLLFCAAVDHYGLPFKKQLLPVHHKIEVEKALEPFFLDPLELLEAFIDYYESTREHPSPLLPAWLPHIMDGDVEKLKLLIEKDPLDAFSGLDSIMKWLLRRGELPGAAEIIELWQPKAKILFGGLRKAWGGK